MCSHPHSTSAQSTKEKLQGELETARSTLASERTAHAEAMRSSTAEAEARHAEALAAVNARWEAQLRTRERDLTEEASRQAAEAAQRQQLERQKSERAKRVTAARHAHAVEALTTRRAETTAELAAQETRCVGAPLAPLC